MIHACTHNVNTCIHSTHTVTKLASVVVGVVGVAAAVGAAVWTLFSRRRLLALAFLPQIKPKFISSDRTGTCP